MAERKTRVAAELKEIKHLEVSSFALTMAIIHSIIAFFVGLLIVTIFLVFMPVMAMGYFPGFLYIFLLIAYPVMGFIGGFVSGAVIAFIYNYLAARYESVRFRGFSNSR